MNMDKTIVPVSEVVSPMYTAIHTSTQQGVTCAVPIVVLWVELCSTGV